MKPFLWICLFALLPPHTVLATENCHSITDRYCGDTLFIMPHGAKVLIKAGANGESFYNLKERAPSDEDYSLFCPNTKCACNDEQCQCEGRCSCLAEVKYLHFEGAGQGIAALNALEEADAKKAQCSFENAIIMRRPDFIYTSPNIISTAIFNMEYCRACGGGCHGSTSLATYNAATGQPYLLKDIIIPNTVAKLQKDLMKAFRKNYVSQEKLEYVNKFLSQDIESSVTTESGFYVENGTVYVNVNSFTLGCASGSFYPVTIPAHYLSPAFLKLLSYK